MNETPSPRRTPRLAGILLRTQPDTRLAALAGEGSEAAFEEIVRRHRRGLFNVAARVTSASAADDVVQDALVRAHAALRRGDRPDNPRAWLFQIARNTALNERRAWRHHDELDDSIDGVEQPPQAAERRFELSSLVSAIGELPDAQRKAIVQRELEGKGHDEIASSMGVSAGAVRQLIFRARATLRTGLGALVPVQLVRLMLLSGNAEQVGGAAGAGLGLGAAAKVGIGAVLTTGAIVAGTGATKDIDRQAISSLATPAVASAAEPRSAKADGDQAGDETKRTSKPESTDEGDSAPRDPRPTPGGQKETSKPPGGAHPGPSAGGQNPGGASQPPQGSQQPPQQQGGAQTRAADCPNPQQQPQFQQQP